MLSRSSEPILSSTRCLVAHVSLALLSALACACEPPSPLAPRSRERASGVTEQAAELHERILTLDTHLDTPANLASPDWDIMQRHDLVSDLSQVDYPRLVSGGLDGGFWAIYTRQGPRSLEGNAQARDAALLRAVRIRETVAAHADQFELALRSEAAPAIAGRHKRVVFLSIENSYPLTQDLSLLQTFYNLGVRMVGPVHTTNNDFADSSTDAAGPEWHGLSELGKRLVVEANRLGVILDGSHASDAVLDQLIELSKTPLILSHSSCKAVFDHPRNVDDERLRRLAAAGGVIQINSLSDYLVSAPKTPERSAALRKLYEEFGREPLDAVGRARFAAAKRDVDKRYPVARASFDDYMAHLLHALRLVGPDHVGIGADWDGGGGVVGMEDITSLPKITERLLREGYDEAALQKIWSGNVLRLLSQAEAQAQILALQQDERPPVPQ